jgi:hypothetical protein
MASPVFPKFSGNRGFSRFNYDVPLEDRHGAPTPRQRAVAVLLSKPVFAASTAARSHGRGDRISFDI